MPGAIPRFHWPCAALPAHKSRSHRCAGSTSALYDTEISPIVSRLDNHRRLAPRSESKSSGLVSMVLLSSFARIWSSRYCMVGTFPMLR